MGFLFYSINPYIDQAILQTAEQTDVSIFVHAVKCQYIFFKKHFCMADIGGPQFAQQFSRNDHLKKKKKS